MSNLVKKIILLFIFLISLNSIRSWTVLPIDNTAIWWVIYLIILALLLKAKQLYYDTTNESNFIFIKAFLIWNIVCFIRGVFIAEDYWEWKHLIGTGLTLLLPIFVFFATNTYYLQKMVNLWMVYVFPSFIIIVLFTSETAYGRYLIPISYTLLFFPLLRNKWKLIALFVASFVILTDLGARSNVIRFFVPFAVSLILYFKSSLLYRSLLFGRILLLSAPFILLTLGITGVFNIFRMSDYIEGEVKVESKNKEWEGDGNLIVDTRTFIYVEVISSALKHDYFWLGRTPARGNESPTFGPMVDKELNRNKNERFGNEVAIANIFTWTGIVGAILYFLIFTKASYLALKKSKSWVIKVVGMYVCFRWFYAWVEDFILFDLNTIFLWVCIAMCYSKSFREFTDQDFKTWVRGFFDQKYRKVILKKTKVIIEKI